MPELRHDAITGHDVVVAVERAARPFTVESAPVSKDATARCPFCSGNEEQTPPEVHRTGEGDAETEGWRVRVVPNLYPIVSATPTADPAPGATPITGAHEVVILSPDHHASFGRLDDDGAVEVLTVIRDRIRVHIDAGHQYVQAFVNQGKAAGASIAHPHAQIVALDAVPTAVERELERFASTDLVAREIVDARNADRTVVDGPAPVWSPFAATVPYGLRIAHRSTRARIDEATDAEIRVVAIGVRDATAALHRLLGDAPYNIVFRTAPPGRPAGEFHWHADLLPRTSLLAGFEEGTGLLVNSVAPEHAAALLREAAAK